MPTVKIKKADTGTVGKIRQGAEVDGVTFWQGEEVELEQEQIDRLKEAGVKLDVVGDDTEDDESPDEPENTDPADTTRA